LAFGLPPPEQGRSKMTPGQRTMTDQEPEHAPPAARAQLVDAAITGRRSVRAFLPTPVSRREVADLLAVASRAPSGTNIQPWRVIVLTGAAKRRLSAAILRVYNDPRALAAHREEYPHYPREWRSPYIERRRKVGWDLYGLLGIAKGDKVAMHAQHGRNYVFFDAPVGLIFTMDRILEPGHLLDYGMFLQSIMIAARARGLDTCAQAAFGRFHRLIRAQLGIPDSQLVLCGMALGVADPAAPENRLLTEREAVERFAEFHGFAHEGAQPGDDAGPGPYPSDPRQFAERTHDPQP
jgi:nitroreductase